MFYYYITSFWEKVLVCKSLSENCAMCMLFCEQSFCQKAAAYVWTRCSGVWRSCWDFVKLSGSNIFFFLLIKSFTRIGWRGSLNWLTWALKACCQVKVRLKELDTCAHVCAILLKVTKAVFCSRSSADFHLWLEIEMSLFSLHKRVTWPW